MFMHRSASPARRWWLWRFPVEGASSVSVMEMQTTISMDIGVAKSQYKPKHWRCVSAQRPWIDRRWGGFDCHRSEHRDNRDWRQDVSRSDDHFVSNRLSRLDNKSNAFFEAGLWLCMSKSLRWPTVEVNVSNEKQNTNQQTFKHYLRLDTFASAQGPTLQRVDSILFMCHTPVFVLSHHLFGNRLGCHLWSPIMIRRKEIDKKENIQTHNRQVFGA